MTTLRLMGISEIAELLNVRPDTVSQWRNRGKLPPPDAVLKMGAVWRAETIEEWRKK